MKYSNLVFATLPSLTFVKGSGGGAWILCGSEYCHPDPTRSACVSRPDGTRGCECINGWGGDYCSEDVNECLLDEFPCPEGASCVNHFPTDPDFPQYKCDCNSDLFSTGTDDHGDTGCVEVEVEVEVEDIVIECAYDSYDECSQTCRSPGRCNFDDDGCFFCDCGFGYTYVIDTQSCIERDECSEDDPCPSDAEGGFCVDYDPDHEEFQGWKCGCREGHKPTGEDVHGATGCEPVSYAPTPSPIDYCADNNCCSDETCVPLTGGSYICDCNFAECCCINGRNADGTCLPEEVRVPCDGRCNPDNQVCDAHNDKCACIYGYYQPAGLGGECFPEDPCDLLDCDRNAKCVVDQCVCKAGYEGSGDRGDCRDINECDDSETNDCLTDEICINTNGGYRCVARTRPPTRAPTRPPTLPTQAGGTTSSECYLLYEDLGDDETAPLPSGCSTLYDQVNSIIDDTFSREDFGSIYMKLLPGIKDFVNKGAAAAGLTSYSTDYETARVRLEEYIFDDKPLDIDTDFTELLALYPAPTGSRSLEEVGETPEAIDEFLKIDNPSHFAPLKSLAREHLREGKEKLGARSPFDGGDDSEAAALLRGSHHVNRDLNDDGLTQECLDGIIRVVIEVIGLLLSALGIRSIVTRPFREYLIQVKVGEFARLTLYAYRQSRGQFDISFFAGLTVSFMAALTWQDIRNALSRLDTADAFSLTIGLFLAIGSTLATGGLALAFAVTSIILNANSLKQDVEYLSEQCFTLCDNFTQSGGQSVQTFYVSLDGSQGNIVLTYEMYRIPDKLELIYEDQTIFTTGGLVSGSRTVNLSIDGDEEFILARITAPNSGTAWNFQIDCPASS